MQLRLGLLPTDLSQRFKIFGGLCTQFFIHGWDVSYHGTFPVACLHAWSGKHINNHTEKKFTETSRSLEMQSAT